MTEWLLCLGCRHRVPVVRGEPKPAHRMEDGRPCGYWGPMQYLREPLALQHPMALVQPRLRLVNGGAS